MARITFDSLRYARRLREAGVPEPQADVQAELMAEAIRFYADNALTRDHFEAVLDAKLDARFAQQDVKFEKRLGNRGEKFFGRFSGSDVQSPGTFNEHNSRVDACFDRLDSIMFINNCLLVFTILVLVVPQLWAWLG